MVSVPARAHPRLGRFQSTGHDSAHYRRQADLWGPMAGYSLPRSATTIGTARPATMPTTATSDVSHAETYLRQAHGLGTIQTGRTDSWQRLRTTEGERQMSTNFRFRQHDNIGVADAEQDHPFLRQCFIDTGEVSILSNSGDPRRIVLGRTGAGKTALLSHFSEATEKVIEV